LSSNTRGLFGSREEVACFVSELQHVAMVRALLDGSCTFVGTWPQPTTIIESMASGRGLFMDI